jgi:hypothetical protein
MEFDRIKKECFWDYDISEEEINTILQENITGKKAFLFEKILLNSTRFLYDLQIFSKDDLKKLIEAYKIPSFNRDYCFRRFNMAEVYFLNKPLLIDELKWTA